MADPVPIRTEFDPSRYLSKVGASDYLEVKWRLVWLREKHPDAAIETELVSHDDQTAIFRARVTIPGGGSATGWGTESYNDFRDFLEKAETKALGRALAALGYGTQFCFDFDFGGASGNVVDSPIDFANTRGRRMNQDQDGGGDRRVASLNQPLTPRQVKFIQGLQRDKGMSDDELNAEVEKVYGKKSITELDRRDASAFIDRLQARRPAADFSDGAAAPPAQPAKSDQERALAHYCIACTERGWSEDASRLLAVAFFPMRATGPTTSRKQLTAAELSDLAAIVEAQTERLADGSTSPLTDYANAIGRASDRETLLNVGVAMKAGGIGVDWLREMWRARGAQMPAGPPTQPTLTDRVKAGRDGEAGNDKWSQ